MKQWKLIQFSVYIVSALSSVHPCPCNLTPRAGSWFLAESLVQQWVFIYILLWPEFPTEQLLLALQACCYCWLVSVWFCFHTLHANHPSNRKKDKHPESISLFSAVLHIMGDINLENSKSVLFVDCRVGCNRWVALNFK